MRSETLLCLVVLAGCSAATPDLADGVIRTTVEDGEGSEGFEGLREVLRRANPGYDVELVLAARALDATDSHRVAFVQAGECVATVFGEGAVSETIEKGAALALRPLERVEFASEMDLVVFTVNAPLGPEIPSFLRPDFDPRIDDQRGGCATEDKPYRRLLLTWRAENGPYVARSLNAHRVRIVDSFTHYHPVEGGFDELYLVQSTTPGARLVTSDRRTTIESPQSVDPAEVSELLREHPLADGELIYIPRGVVHRGVGGAVVMVITIPGFRPGAEIGVDHHLRAIAERCGDSRGIQYNVEASKAPVVR